MKVMIIGGGIGGLCLAQGLRREGIDVVVYERDETALARPQGFRIHISPLGSKALHECLPADLYKLFVDTCGVFGQGFTMVSEQLVELMSMVDSRRQPEDPVLAHRSASRITLRRILLAGLDDAVHFGKRFQRYTEGPSGEITAHFDDGSTASADLLIGADGVNSPVRKQFLPNADPIDTGVVAIGGKVPMSPAIMALMPAPLLSGPMMIMAKQPVSLFMAVWRRDPERQKVLDAALPSTAGAANVGDEDYVILGMGAKREVYGRADGYDDLNGYELIRIVREQVRTWHPDVRKMVELLDPDTMGATRIRSSEPVEAWSTGRVTLLGDAIHSMTPYRGIGANVALRDAALLRDELAQVHRGEVDLSTAVAGYEEQMREYAFAAVKMSRDTMERSVSNRGAGFTIMKGVMRTVNSIPTVKNKIMSRMGDE